MFINRLKRFNFLSVFLFFSLFISSTLFAQAADEINKETEVYKKKVHPRSYDFDLCDSLDTIFLGYNKENGRFETYVNFTSYVKKDMPLTGDVVNLYYKGSANNYAGTIYARLLDVDNNNRILSLDQPVLCENLDKGQICEGQVSFNLTNNASQSFYIYLFSDKENLPGKVDQVYFRFNRVVKTTNIEKEKAEEKRAIRQKKEIVEVTVEEESPAPLPAEKTEDEELARKAAEEEEKRKAEEEAKRKAAEEEAARLKAKAEEEAAALEKALAEASKNNSSYKKEFLSDYMVQEEPELDTVEETEEIIENPDQKDLFGRTLLMKAAKAGNDWQIKTLLKSGANVNLKDNDGWTALMYAVRYQESLNSVKLLIEAGADVKALNNFKTSALSLASSYNNNPEIIKTLLSYYNPADKEVIKSFVLLLTENHSSEYTQISKINIYIEASIPVNNFYEGKTPLMYACEFGNSTKVIKTLIDNNAVVTIRSTEGKTAYDYASENKKLPHDSTYWELNKK